MSGSRLALDLSNSHLNIFPPGIFVTHGSLLYPEQ